MTLLAACSLAIWVYLLFGHGRFWQAGPVLPQAPGHGGPAVTIVVPARDEAASVVRCLRSLLAQDYGGAFRVVLVDDGSGDGTGALARAMDDERLTVIPGAERPPGWSGKLWALQQGVERARTPLLFLTDADIEHRPGHLSSLVAQAERAGLDLVSEMVALNCESVAERALVPAFVFFFQLLYPFARVNDAGSRVAAAAGGTILVRRAALERAGGLAAMRGALIDDVTLAGLVKRSGRIWLGHGLLAASIRPYPGAGDVWRMVARTAYVQLRYSPVLLAGTVAGLALVFVVPPSGALFGHGAARIAGLLGWAALTGAYLPTLRRFRVSPAWAPLLPAVACFYMAATLGSAWNHITRRGVTWKRRAYHA
jgi:hopene-associated glycosyltransferase HpnB